MDYLAVITICHHKIESYMQSLISNKAENQKAESSFRQVVPQAHIAAHVAVPAYADAHSESHPARSQDKLSLSFFCSPCLEAMYDVMACKVFPAFSIKVSSRFRFVGAFMCVSETSKLSAAETVVVATAGGGVDDVNADRDCGSDDVCSCLSESVTLESWKKKHACINECCNNEHYFFHRYLLLKKNGLQ